jgi:hypothetical protein
MTSDTGESGTEGWQTDTGDDAETEVGGPADAGAELGDSTDAETEGGDPSTTGGSSPPAAVESRAGEGLGWRGWILVGWLVVAMVVAPWGLVFLPELQGVVESVGLGLRDAYLVVPMVPALGLGALAVWAAVRSRQSE